jgi:hypothetical protein
MTAYDPEDPRVDDLFELLNQVIHDDLKELGVPFLTRDESATPITPHLANALLPKILEWAAVAQADDRK